MEEKSINIQPAGAVTRLQRELAVITESRALGTAYALLRQSNVRALGLTAKQHVTADIREER